MLRSVEAEDHMTRSPVTLSPETHIFEAIPPVPEEVPRMTSHSEC